MYIIWQHATFLVIVIHHFDRVQNHTNFVTIDKTTFLLEKSSLNVKGVYINMQLNLLNNHVQHQFVSN